MSQRKKKKQRRVKEEMGALIFKRVVRVDLPEKVIELVWGCVYGAKRGGQLLTWLIMISTF